uniref:Uncharacterized protein n=1 Tax=Xiphophorus maculatus TaxID=8083 RepID=A0A3B5R273_XIPMA
PNFLNFGGQPGKHKYKYYEVKLKYMWMQTVSVWQKSHLSILRHFSFLVKTKMTKFLQQKISHFSIEFIFFVKMNSIDHPSHLTRMSLIHFPPGGPAAPLSPCGPCGPGNPGFPLAPGYPFAPGSPFSPGFPGLPPEPLDPLGPGSPRAPVEPFGPVAPASPVGPRSPFGPTRPGIPLSPLSPFCPVIPIGPCGPLSPLEPFGPEKTKEKENTACNGFLQSSAVFDTCK